MYKEVVPKKKTLFVMEKYIEDVRQDEKTRPDKGPGGLKPAFFEYLAASATKYC